MTGRQLVYLTVAITVGMFAAEWLIVRSGIRYRNFQGA